MTDEETTVADLVEEFLAQSLSGEFVSVGLIAVDAYGTVTATTIVSEDHDGEAMLEAFSESLHLEADKLH